ncbi:hypothetical protein [Pseudomonas sp. PSKL.D1]|uniref:hypothetical protein n=1 Tax=Pseudomonas sp. PSKL.D1 TaxID=3029060 RepID=UPI002381165D|nr:hypothetical protein [Pseudomonas sp. PSKL.D1]WDY57188.1 hypothetical protein PVV54_21825 [Pseudomonas sp. PSKL.D1]
MATIETKVFAQGLLRVESSWQSYIHSQKRAEGLTGKPLELALAASAQSYRRFQNQSLQFYAQVRKCVGDAEKLESDMILYPHYYLPKS